MATDSIPLKQCSRKDKCCNPLGSWLPATNEYFGKSKRTADGLNTQCKECVNSRVRAQYHVPETRASRLAKRAEKRTNPEWREHKNALARGYFRRNMQDPAFRERRARRIHQYMADNPDKKRKYYDRANKRQRELRASDPNFRTKLLARDHLRWLKTERRQWKQEYDNKRRQDPAFRERVRIRQREYIRKYRHTPHGKIKIKTNVQRRKARTNNLPDTLTAEQWQYAINYFHGRCAICERQLNHLFDEHRIAMDHWIPIASPDCPGTVAINVLPLCHGIDGCNNSKGGKDPEAWLRQRFNEHKAQQILKRIQTYFDSLTD